MFILNSKFLKFQNVEESEFLPIHTPDEPCLLNFPENYIGFIARLSLWCPNKDINHDGLELVLCGKTENPNYVKINNQIQFQINKNTLELDFVGIQMLQLKTALTDYEMNSVRLNIGIYHQDGALVHSKISYIIRNINYDVSKEIRVLSIGRNLEVLDDNRDDNELIIFFAKPIPYFPQEMQIQIESQEIVPMKNEGFPTNKLHFKAPIGFMVNYHESDIRITCPYFDTKWFIKSCPEETSIGSRRMKSTYSTSDSKDSDILDSNVTKPAISETETNKGKEICIVIGYYKFKNPKKNREVGYYKDKSKICSHFGKSYEIKILENMTTVDLKIQLNQIIKNDIKKNHQHVLVFVTSHGRKQKFSTDDSHMTFDELVNLFLSPNCPQLCDKGKLFFISCCQGDKINNFHINGQVTNSVVNKTDMPMYSNVFIGYSTVSGFTSMRGPQGTPYIQTFVKVASEHPDWDVRKIQAEVQKRLSHMICPNSHIPIASETNCLTKNTYFKLD